MLINETERLMAVADQARAATLATRRKQQQQPAIDQLHAASAAAGRL